MKSNWTDTTIDDAVKRSIKEIGLHRAFHSTIRRLLLSESTEWNVCCGADCNPCVAEFARAVDRAREILEAA